MTIRQEQILKSIIDEYIKDAQPVGSKKMADNFDFGIGPAMIRQEMAVLEKRGYLAQPHTSAGRIPTDKAYRAYISGQEKKGMPKLSSKEREKIKNTIRVSDDTRNLLKDLSKLVAELSSEMSISGLVGQDLMFTCGLSQLLDEPELQNLDHISQLMRFVDDSENHFDNLWARPREGYIKVFIGKENPINEIRDFTLITGQYVTPSGEEGFLSIVGPRRMNYKKNMALIEYISQSISALAQG